MGFWKLLWTITWFGGLVVFTYLWVQVTRFGWRDLRVLFRTVEADAVEERPR
ncbi:MAG: hypothetical protein IT204_12395 [Fimbriimonadaceae bacterium]|nr:hypothetical protein [Fimbriimonadaceae bacterium]